MKHVILKNAILTIGIMFNACHQAEAADWFETQTIAQPAWGAGQLSGFWEPAWSSFQNSAVHTGSPAGYYTPKSDLVSAPVNATTGLNTQRIRPIYRGLITPDISYFVAAELSPSAYTYSFGNYAPRLVDADLTFSNYIPGARIVAGIIRPPGAEGASEACLAYTFLDLAPQIINQLAQPTFYAADGHYTKAGSGPGSYLVPGSQMSGNNGFRYPGIEATDWFELTPKIEVAYGAFLGDYGRQFEAQTSNGTIGSGRLQASYLFNGNKGGIFRSDITGFVWYQQSDPTFNGVSNTMIRDGFGATYRQDYMKTWGKNLKAEYIYGSGNIMAPGSFQSAPGLSGTQTQTSVYAGSNNIASGYAISGGLFFTPHIELTMRYDYYDRLPNLAYAGVERQFNTIGAGLQYHITPKTKIVIDDFDRRVSIPHQGSLNTASYISATNVVDAVGNQFDIWANIEF
jgi:hypothetical protein